MVHLRVQGFPANAVRPRALRRVTDEPLGSAKVESGCGVRLSSGGEVWMPHRIREHAMTTPLLAAADIARAPHFADVRDRGLALVLAAPLRALRRPCDQGDRAPLVPREPRRRAGRHALKGRDLGP
ncbi:hypothetical protein Lesp02_01210 [Lentzea sp. NBRC 105346]|nr:hypothetical protein Lesp02_01210 [Lentzea sp. NBRC 105346]